MPVNPYDDRKVSLRRPHGNGDLDIVGASYTRRKANVTEACIFVLKKLLYSSEYSDCFEELYSKKKHAPLRIKLLLYGLPCYHYPANLIIAKGFENQLLDIMNQTMIVILGW